MEEHNGRNRVVEVRKETGNKQSVVVLIHASLSLLLSNILGVFVCSFVRRRLMSVLSTNQANAEEMGAAFNVLVSSITLPHASSHFLTLPHAYLTLPHWHYLAESPSH